MKRNKVPLFTLFFLALLSASNIDANMLTRTKVIMGTFVSISLEAEDKKHFKPAFALLKSVDNSLSSFKEDSPIYKLNKNKNASLDYYSYEALTLSKHYYQTTDAYFNIAIGSITKDLYKFGQKEQLPTKKLLHTSNTSLEALHFNKKKATLSQAIKIDLGGMGKGYGVDTVAAYFKTQHIQKAIIAASGDIRCLHQCKIEINNPFSKKYLASFQTKSKDMGISTSGNYEHYVQSTFHNHLINPKTKSSQKNFISITLISKLKSATLDAYATAVSVMPKAEAFAFLKKQALAFIILDTNKKLTVSQNINRYVDKLLINDCFNK